MAIYNVNKDTGDITETAGKYGSSEEYTEISYENWLALTPAQQENGKWDVTGVPGADGTVSFDLMTKLWENPNPTSTFASQNITLSSADYDLLMVVYKNNLTDNYNSANIMAKGNGLICNYCETTRDPNVTVATRGFTYVDATHYTINGAVKQTSGAVRAADNNYLIPIAIYGIKTTASVKVSAIAENVSTSADKCMLSDGVTSVEDRLDAHTISDNTKVTLTIDTDYTTLSDGYFRISANSGNNYAIGRINGINMAVVNGTSFGSAGSCSFFVRKGTVIQFSGTAGKSSGFFYPLA